MTSSAVSPSSKQKDSVRLKKLRESMNLSVRKFAEEFKVTHGAISKWESGKLKIPGPILRLIELYEQKFPKRK